MKPLQVLVPNRGISWGSWSREQEWCTAVFPLGRSNTDIMITAFPCANLRNCLFSGYAVPTRTLGLGSSFSPWMQNECPMWFCKAVGLSFHCSQWCKLFAALGLHGWAQNPLFKKEWCCFSLSSCTSPELVKSQYSPFGVIVFVLSTLESFIKNLTPSFPPHPGSKLLINSVCWSPVTFLSLLSE